MYKLNPLTGKLDYYEPAEWGSVSGTLSDQTDIQTALNTKAEAVGLTKITVGTTVPSTPSPGDLWVDTN